MCVCVCMCVCVRACVAYHDDPDLLLAQLVVEISH